MKKIPSLFQRNYETDRLVRNEVVLGCEWVLAGEGIATEKIDGTCCLIQNGIMFKRYELKRGKSAPKDFLAAQDPDPVTGDVPGWVRVTDGPDDKWHREAMEQYQYWADNNNFAIMDGTYELLGPKVQGNIYQLPVHALHRHGETVLFDVPRDYEGICVYLANDYFEAYNAQFGRDVTIERFIEGIVFHHPDGKMVKVKRKDFGLMWPVRISG